LARIACQSKQDVFPKITGKFWQSAPIIIVAQKTSMSHLGQKQTSRHLQPMSALPSKADIGTQPLNVRFVPKADICTAAILSFIRSPRRRAQESRLAQCIWRDRKTDHNGRSASETPQSTVLVQGNVISLIALYFVLRVVLACVMSITFVIEIFGVHSHNLAADTAASEFQIT
jgi:hypothetical protein